MTFYQGQGGNQAGDPQKVAALYIECVEMEEPWENHPWVPTVARAYATYALRP